MDDRIEANRRAWATLSADHHEEFRRRLRKKATTLNDTQIAELGDIEGKSLIHLQCNTGADTISLARMGARVTGVDLVPENVGFARELAVEFGVPDARFFEADVLELQGLHDEQYDIVYSTEGALCWLPDLRRWARSVRHVLADDGFLYLFDSHPFFMVWDEEALPELVVKYPYFGKEADRDEFIGGYAAERRRGPNYSWGYTMGEIVTSLSEAGLHVDWLHEYDWLFFRLQGEGHEAVGEGKWRFARHQGRLPFSFSLKATVR